MVVEMGLWSENVSASIVADLVPSILSLSLSRMMNDRRKVGTGGSGVSVAGREKQLQNSSRKGSLTVSGQIVPGWEAFFRVL
jgi:hypothetical protein